MQVHPESSQMSNSGPIPIFASPNKGQNAYNNEAFSYSSHGSVSSPQSPPYYMDPRSPRAVFPVPPPMHSPIHSFEQSLNDEYYREELFLHQKILDEIREELINGIDDDFWGFLTYMESNQYLVSSYMRGTAFTVDNSANPIDNTSLGLGSLPNGSSKAQKIRQNVHKGIVLSSDGIGNIYLSNESKVPVIIKGFHEPERFCVSEEVIRRSGIIHPGNETVKVFDIEEFRCQMGLQLLHGYNDEEQLRLMSLLRICFAEVHSGLNSPSWLLLVNLKALQLVGNEKIETEIQDYIAQLKVSNNQQYAKNLPNKKNKMEFREEPRRKIRIELRKQNKKIKDHMKYSWDDVFFKKDAESLNLDTLKEQFEEPDIDYDKTNDDDEEENSPEEEPKLQVNLQRLKTIVREQGSVHAHASSAQPKNDVRPVKRWAKLHHIVKHSTSEISY